MIGNDVVDLDHPDTQPGATHPRFDARVFAPVELDTIRSSSSPERVRWSLWAAKESAYKLLKQDDPAIVFLPVRFVVETGSLARVPCPSVMSGTVRHDNHLVAFRAVELHGAVHVIATLPAHAARTVLAEVQRLKAPCASTAVRALAIAAIARRLGVASAALAIVRAARVPQVRLNGMRAPIDLSLSHHGRFVAFAARFTEELS